MLINERYSPIPIGAGDTIVITGNAIGGFLCTTAGTITVVANKADGKPQTTIINALPVTAGVYYPLPFYLGKEGGTVTSAGAVGLIGV